MRVVEVDERDSSWESSAPRFRLYTFEGAAGAVTTLDFLDAQIHDVLEAANLAGTDGRLWSIALVVDSESNGRGMVWLSGMDYNDTPTTPAEWRMRATMQDRYLMARSQRGEEPLLPDGRRVIRVFPDHGHRWPLWESFSGNYTVSPADLGLSSSLSDGLRHWYDEWEQRGIDWHPDDRWLHDGHRLVELMRAEVGTEAEVRPEFDRPI